MTMEPTIELTNEYGATFTLCTNAETLCDGHLAHYGVDDVNEVYAAGVRALEAAAAAEGMECGVCESERSFSAWHGGRLWWGSVAYRSGPVALDYCGRNHNAGTEDDDLDDWTEWAWVKAAEVPDDLRAAAERIARAVSSAMEAELARLAAVEDAACAEGGAG